MEAAGCSCSFFLQSWESQIVLSSAIVVSLLLYLASKVHDGIRKWAAGEETAGAPALVFGCTPDGVAQRTRKHSIRYLLCDNMKCALCAQAAEEAAQMVRPPGRGLQSETSLKPLALPATCAVAHSSWRGLPLPTGQDNFPQSFSQPVPIGGHSCLPLRAASTGSLAGSLSEQPQPCLPPSRGEERLPCPVKLVWSKVTLCSSFSSVSGFSISSRSEGSSSSTPSEAALLRAVVLRKEVCEYCHQIEGQVFPDRRGREEVFPERDKPFPSTRQEAAPDRPSGPPRQKEEPMLLRPSEPERAGGGAVDTPFMAEATRVSLERHLLAKRIQHAMGLPLALLRSLKAFIPQAPASTSGPPARSLVVAPRPQAPPFLSEDTKRELEQHLRKMVRLKRWGLPRRVQEALRHMRPDFRAPGESASAGDPGTEGAGQAVPWHKDMAYQPTPASQFPAPDKMAGEEGRKPPVAGLSLQGHREQQPSSQPVSQRKADKVELRAKHRPVQAVPPTQVISKAPTWSPGMQPTPEERQTRPPPPAGLERLEQHILRKRLQHHWGLPRLVQRSLAHFLPPAPPLPAPRHVPTRPFRPKVNVFLGAGQLRFLPAETQRRLEDHLRSQVTERRWGLPKRALQSLRTFIPVAPPETKAPREREQGRVSPTGKRSLSARAPGPCKRHVDWSEEEPGPSSWQRKYRALQRHLAKKALEIQLGLFRPMVQHSRETLSRGRRRALPKIAYPGPRAVQPRCQEIPFVEPAGLEQIKMNIKHKNLADKWGLPTIYRKSLARLSHGATPPAPHSHLPTKATGVDFSATEAPFIGKRTREELEWHVRRKQMQHIWGLPGRVQGALRHLLPAPSLPPQPPRPGREEVMVSLQPLSFLSKETEQKLDLNVRKRIIMQRWGLPRVVLRSLRGLCPEQESPPLGRKAARTPPALPRGRPPCRPSIRTSPGAPSDVEGRGTAAPHQAEVCPLARPKVLGMMALHTAQKAVEVWLGILPPVVQQSRQLALLSRRRPLPRLIRRGQGTLQPRRSFLPFARGEDVDRIKVAVSRSHLASLWGLGLRYTGALAAMVPKPPSSWRTPRRPGLEFQEMPTPFLPRQAREALELSVRKKRLQHEWSLPALIQKSLKAFLEGLPVLPTRSGAEAHVSVLPQEVSFLPQDILSHLEVHLQKMKLHRQWGLPRRVLQYLRELCPQTRGRTDGHEVARSPLAAAPCSHCMYSASSAVSRGPGTQAAKPVVGTGRVGRSPQPFVLESRVLGRLRLHVAKKALEVRLGAFPTLARLSWRRTAFKRHLPRLLFPGQNPLQPRSPFLPFVRREDVDQIELAVRHNHLRALWGLGTLFVEAVAGMVPALLPRPLPPSRAPFVFSGARTAFLPVPEREALERLVRRKRLQHLWGLPGLIQRARAAFMHRAPKASARPKTHVLVQPHAPELPFLSPGVCRTLELHVQKMRIQRQWGLPSRVLKSLKAFLPSEGQTASESRPPRRPAPSPPDGGSPSAERSGSPGSRPRREEAHPSEAVPAGSSVSHPTIHIHPVTKGSQASLRGKRDVPSGDGLLGVAQLRGEGRQVQASPLPVLLRRGARPPEPRSSVNKKLSLIGSILEKKLHLQHGLHTWLRDQERLRVFWKEREGLGGLSGADRSALQWGTVPRGTVRWEEGQCGCQEAAGTAVPASEEAQGPSLAHPPRSQPFQAGRMKPLVRLEGDSAGWVSGKPSRAGPKGKGRSLALEGISSREGGRARARAMTMPTTKGRKQGPGNRERREQRPSSKEWRPSSKERSVAIKEWHLSSTGQRSGSTRLRQGSRERHAEQALSTTERRPGSKEERPTSQEQALRSKEQSQSIKERKPGSTERRLSTKEQRPESMKRRPQSKGRAPGGEERRSSSKERRAESMKRGPETKGQAPGGEELRPGSKEQRPGSTEVRLSSKEQRPESMKRRPESKGQAPGGEEQRSRSKERRPGSKERRLSSKERGPESMKRGPESKDQVPGGEERRSRSKERRPGSMEMRLSSKERRPESMKRGPETEGQAPGSEERRSSSKERGPESMKRGPETKGQVPGGEDRRSRSKERGPEIKGQVPGSEERRSRSKERRPESMKRGPETEGQAPGSEERRSRSKERRPGSTERRLSSKEQRSESMKRGPESKDQAPGGEERRSRSKERRPGSMEMRLSSKEQRPESMKREPESKGQEPGSEERRSRSRSKERRPGSKE